MAQKSFVQAISKCSVPSLLNKLPTSVAGLTAQHINGAETRLSPHLPRLRKEGRMCPFDECGMTFALGAITGMLGAMLGNYIGRYIGRRLAS